MLRRLRLIFSIVCLVLSLFVAWLLAESTRRPPIVSYTSEQTETILTVLSGCFEYGRAVPDQRVYLNPPYPKADQGWRFGYVIDAVGETQLPSFFPGFARSYIFIDSFGPQYYGSVLAGYWVQLLLLIPALPLLWRKRRTISFLVFPTAVLFGSIVIWDRSYHNSFSFYLNLGPNLDIQLKSTEGLLLLREYHQVKGDPPEGYRSFLSWDYEKAGFAYVQNYGDTKQFGRATIPDVVIVGWQRGVSWIWMKNWLFATFASVFSLPLLTFETCRRYRRMRFHRHTTAELCGHCGYDLRASPDRCPECGASQSATAV